MGVLNMDRQAAAAEVATRMAETATAKERGYGPGRFSFNVKGGRCEACQGDGMIKVEMHFLPDIYVPCAVCHGKRYNRETLEVMYKGKSIDQVLDMTVEAAHEFFSAVPALSSQSGPSLRQVKLPPWMFVGVPLIAMVMPLKLIEPPSV